MEEVPLLWIIFGQDDDEIVPVLEYFKEQIRQAMTGGNDPLLEKFSMQPLFSLLQAEKNEG